jgi:hypothetical protein
MIGFLHPWMLAGLAAAGIPIVLHLLARREPPTIVFPAVRYLIDTTREHRRRLKLQNWLLLLLRTLLIAMIVLAAAGPTMALRGVPGHSPSALALIVDNSASSGAVVAGTPRLAQLQVAARAVIARATPNDALWLIAADGVPRRGDPTKLLELVNGLTVSPRRLDLGEAIALARDVLGTDVRPGQIVLVSDLQATALSEAAPGVPLVVARPDDEPIRNVGLASLDVGAQPWSTDGGRVSVSLAGDSGTGVPVSVRIGTRPPRQALVAVGGVAGLAVPPVPGGWHTLTAELDADELRADDRRTAVVRVAPVARVRCAEEVRYIAAACDVLERNGRSARGDEVSLGSLGPGTSVVQPPADPAELGALNRELARRGAGWSFGRLVAATATADSGALAGRERVLRRYTLEPSGTGGTGVLATVGGAPWIVRGSGVVLLGSRLEPEWTDLPVSAGFMPLMDALVNRAARGEVALVSGMPGDPVPLPDVVSAVRRDTQEWKVEGGAPFRAPEPGVYYLLAGADTAGALSVNIDSRESRLARAPDAQVRRLWRDAEVVGLRTAGGAAFSAGARGDLRGPLLWAALLVGLAEVALASGWRRQA